MKKLYIIGKVLTLNTIDNLSPGEEVLISRHSVFLSPKGELYLQKKAQFVSKGVEADSFIIPLKVNSGGNYSLDFTEVGFAFISATDKEINSLKKDEWINCFANVEKQKDEYDYIKRLNITYSFDKFDDSLVKGMFDKKHDFIRKHFISKILVTEDKEILEDIINYCKADYDKRIQEDDDLEPDEKEKALRLNKKAKPELNEVLRVAEMRLKELTESEESQEAIQERMWIAIEQEKFEDAARLRDQMIKRGFSYIAERPHKTT